MYKTFEALLNVWVVTFGGSGCSKLFLYLLRFLNVWVAANNLFSEGSPVTLWIVEAQYSILEDQLAEET